MIYVKYINKDDPSYWYIYAHEKGAKTQIQIVDWQGSTNLHIWFFNLKEHKKYFKIKYLTKEQVDLLKLELL